MSAQIRVAIAGFGAIGFAVAEALDNGIGGLELAAVSARDAARAQNRMSAFKNPVPVLPFTDLAAQADVVIECLPAAHFAELAVSVLGRGGTLIPLSVGALLPRPELIDLARAKGGTIIVPTGALLGLDAVRACAEGPVESVTLVTRKPPGGLAGAPHLVDNDISVENLTEPKLVFEGTARDGARGFPANVNVGAALSLAGIGPDKTTLQIWADPTVTRNTHTVQVEADAARLTMTIENVPTEENPKTGKITALSVLATLRRMAGPLRVGT
ncbi:aspartate dehydrogenase [Pelagibius litoralis]|uniref:aspartate dehydrogenase n=1 Tax=Pelagibius litoralis TaxID=374515 RepID=UPI001F0D37BF|nr:aspartate dehydrogenase [Pelagibius litoralis]